MKSLHDVITAFLIAAASLLVGCSAADKNSMDADSGSNSSVIQFQNSSAIPLSSNDSSETSTFTPIVFSDEDKELQKILLDLQVPTEEISSWYASAAISLQPTNFIFPQFNSKTEGLFVRIPDNFRANGDFSPFEMPTTLSEMKEIILEYFSEQRAQRFVKDIARGTVTEETDGTYFVTFLDGVEQFSEGFFSQFLELDGRLYRRDGIKPTSINMDCETAKIISENDDTIEFCYLLNSYSFQPNTEYKNEDLFYEYALKGTLKYERGGWKLDSWGDTLII